LQALHFYFDSSEKRCFLEELPSDTIVEGTLDAAPLSWTREGMTRIRRGELC
jgi:hypothetical protein